MKTIGIALFLILHAPSGWCATQTLSAQGGQVEILAVGRPSFIKIHGTGAAPQGQVQVDGNAVRGDFEFELATLDTGIEMRDKHMKNTYLEVDKYPKAHLAIEHVKAQEGWSLAKPNLNGASFDGKLTLHGVTKPVQGVFSMGDKRNVEAKFNVKLSDFQVTAPAFAGITVKDEVEIKVAIEKLSIL